jgi:rhodanese-related sulfurtransferase
MRTVSATIAQTIVLLILGAAIGVGVNTVRGKDKISLSRNYFPPPSVTPATTHAAPTSNQAVPTTQAAPKSEFQELTLEQALEIFEDPRMATGEYVFVDARADGPYQEGHIPGAIQCDYYRSDTYLTRALSRVYGADKAIVYCNGGDCEDSLLVCREFLNLGVPSEKVYLFRGGWQAWKDAGEPIEVGDQ